MQLLHAVGRSGFPVDALRVEAVHLHMLQHHLQHHGNRVLLIDQATHPHPEVVAAALLVVLRRQQMSKSAFSSFGNTASLKMPFRLAFALKTNLFGTEGGTVGHYFRQALLVADHFAICKNK